MSIFHVFTLGVWRWKMSTDSSQLSPLSHQWKHSGENEPGYINPYVQCARSGQVFPKGRFFTTFCFSNLHHPKREETNKGWDMNIKIMSRGCSCKAVQGGLSNLCINDDVCWLIHLTSLTDVQRFHQMLYCLQRELQLEFTCRLSKIYLEGEQHHLAKVLWKLNPILHSLSL